MSAEPTPELTNDEYHESPFHDDDSPQPKGWQVVLLQWTAPSRALLLIGFYWGVFLLVLTANFIGANTYINSTVSSLFVGTALNSNAYDPRIPIRTYITMNFFRILRFFLIPFVVGTVSVGCSACPCCFLLVPTDRVSTIIFVVGVLVVIAGISIIRACIDHDTVDEYFELSDDDEEGIDTIEENLFEWIAKYTSPWKSPLTGLFVFWIVTVSLFPMKQVEDRIPVCVVIACILFVLFVANNFDGGEFSDYLMKNVMKTIIFFVIPFCVCVYNVVASQYKFRSGFAQNGKWDGVAVVAGIVAGIGHWGINAVANSWSKTVASTE